MMTESTSEGAGGGNGVILAPIVARPSLLQRVGSFARSVPDLVRSHKSNLLVTLAYCFSFVGLGISLTGFGPTLLELVELTQSSTQEIGIIFTIKGCGYLFGSMSGRLFDRFDGHKLLFIDIVVASIVFSFVPFITTVWGQGIAWFVIGIFTGSLDTGVNTLIVWIWKDKVNPFMQLIHFSFGLGAFLSPLVIAALQEDTLFKQYVTLAVPFGVSSIPLLFLPRPKNSFVEEVELKEVTNETPASPPQSLAIKERDQLLEGGSGSGIESASVDTNSAIGSLKAEAPATPRRLRIEVVVFASILLLLDVGAEMGFGGWIFTYAVEQLHFSDKDAALVNAVFWGTFMTGRAAAVFIATVATPKAMLYADILGCSASLLILLMFPASPAVLWIGCMVFGWSIASVFPTVISLPQNLGVRITGTDTSWMVVGASAGEMVVPLLVGTLQEHYSMLVLVLVILIVEVLGGIVFTLLLVRVKCVKGEMRNGCAWWQSASSSQRNGDDSRRGNFVILNENQT